MPGTGVEDSVWPARMLPPESSNAQPCTVRLSSSVDRLMSAQPNTVSPFSSKPIARKPRPPGVNIPELVLKDPDLEEKLLPLEEVELRK